MKVWQVWFVPTEIGKEKFGWEDKQCGDDYLVDVDAYHAAHKLWSEDRLRGKLKFYNLHVREVEKDAA